jgi:type IV secretory pathway VirB10-like protein
MEDADMTITMMDSRSLRVPTYWRVLTEWLPQGSIAMSPIKILLAFSAMAALLMVFAIQRLPGDERIEVPKAQFIETLPAQTSVATKSDPIRIIDTIRPEPKPVVTERVVPDAPGREPPVAKVDEEATERPAVRRMRQARAESNVCTRHNMRKVMVGKYRWRCRR